MKYNSVRIEVYHTECVSAPYLYSWRDISQYINDDQPITFSRGIMGNKLQDRTARPGVLSFLIKEQKIPCVFYPLFDSPTSETIIKIGMLIRVVFEHDGISYVKFFGKIIDINPPRDNLYKTDVTVICRDYLAEINKALQTPSITLDKTAAEVVEDVLSGLGITLGSDQAEYNVCATTFDTVFDTVSSKQNALSEISKAIIGELGYFYLKGSRNVSDELNSTDTFPTEGNFVLTVDGRNTREGRAYRTIPVGNDVVGNLLQEDGDFLLQENGGEILLDETEEAELFDDVINIDHVVTDKIINHVYVQVYPREYSGSTEVLFSMTNTPKIVTGETLEMTVKYKDPDNKAKSITARSAIVPVASTDYTANAERDGSGADLTANLAVTAVYNAADINYMLENTGGTDLYITKLQARGQGILFYESLTAESENAGSVALYGEIDERVNMKYRSDIVEAQEIADAIITNLAGLTRQVNGLTIRANDSSRNLFMAMFLEIGDPVKIPLPDNDFIQTDYKFYINGLSFTGRRGVWDVTYIPASCEVVEI
jgi:hypothetical protein